MRAASWAMMAIGTLAMTGGCGDGGKAPPAPQGQETPKTTAGAGMDADEPAATVSATRAQVEEAQRCRGLMAATLAAKAILRADLPPDLAELNSSAIRYWSKRAGSLRAPDMSEAELDALIAKSTRVLMTRQAIEREVPAIRQCLAAQKAG